MQVIFNCLGPQIK